MKNGKAKILITGGTGFIARNLFEQLGDEYNVVAPNRQELNLLDSSKVLGYIKKSQFNVIIHVATYDAAARFSTKDPAMVLENNLKMFFNIIRGEDYFGKMIYFGSGAEFDREHWVPKMKEDYFDKYIPTDQYGFSKYVMAKYAQMSNKIYELRLFGMFGKYDDWRTRFIPNACCHAVLDLAIRIDQNKYYDFLYVNDLVRIVKWFIDNKPKYNSYNVCTGDAISFRAIAERIIKISGKKLDIDVKTDGLGREYSGDNTLLMGELKNFQFTPIDESLEELYNWYDSNKNIINRDQL